MKKKTIIIMAIVFIFMVLGNVNDLNAKPRAQRSQMMKHSGFNLKMVERNLLPARMLLRLKTDIGLNDSQVKKIENMQLNYQKFVIKSSADAKLLTLKVNSEFNKEKVNRGKAINLIKKIASIKTEIQVNRINYLLDVKSVLTKTQLEKINTLRKERRARMFNRRNKRSGKRTAKDMRRPRV